MLKSVLASWLFVALAASALAAEPRLESGYVTTHDGHRLYYERAGSGKQTVILPGRLFMIQDFKKLAVGRTLISYDMRNRGKSDRVEDVNAITIENDIRDLESVRRHFNVAKFTPVGYSYLGLMVVLYAAQHPDRVERIVQIGAVPRKWDTEFPEHLRNRDLKQVIPENEWSDLEKVREQGMKQKSPREYCIKQWNVVSRRLLVAHQERREQVPMPCDMENEWPINFERHLKAHFEGSVQKLDVKKEYLRQVKVPVLTVHGKKDRNAAYGAGREWALTLPNARLITVENGAHQVWVDDPQVLDDIDTFLQGKWPSRAERISAM
ncbi:MAG: alpha/beta hydrolase [Acidobacteriales bacterium]|nr:alpha/beta hydrolase [Terriglobales bacterium]